MVLVTAAAPVHQIDPPPSSNNINGEDDANTFQEAHNQKNNQSISVPAPDTLVDDSRQGFGKFHLSNSTMPSNISNKSPNDNSGRDSPPSLRVRFSDSDQLNHNTMPQVTPILTAKEKQTTSGSNGNASPNDNKVTDTTLSRPAVSVFERLAKAETVAFMNQKFLNQESTQQRTMKRSTSAPPSLRAKNYTHKQTYTNNRQSSNPTKIQTKTSSPEKKQFLTEKFVQLASTSFELFERLAEKHTALSKSRRRERSESKTDAKNKTPLANGQTRRSRRTRRRSLGRTHSFDRWKTTHDVALNKKPTTTTVRKKKIVPDILDDTFDLESTGPPLEIEFSSRTKILCSNKFEPEAGFEELDLFELGLNSPLSEYEAGAMSAKEFASEIMNALLWRDLPSNVKWDVKRPLERELAMPIGEIGYSFLIEATGNSILDDCDLSEDGEEELYSASATGNVTFLPDREVQVENYSCVYTYDDMEM